MAIKMGYDSIVGVAICFVAAGLGFAGALLNPFTIGIAQGLSNLPLFSGIEYRMFCWLVINVIGIAFILRYAAKIKKNPTKSIVYLKRILPNLSCIATMLTGVKAITPIWKRLNSIRLQYLG